MSELIDREDLLQALDAAHNALRSYQYGNSSPELAEEIADHLASLLMLAGRPPLLTDIQERKIGAKSAKA